MIIRSKGNKPPRRHTVQFNLNDKEKQALDKYCKKYRITNRSKFIRETLISNILEQFEDDYPSLFESLDKNDQ